MTNQVFDLTTHASLLFRVRDSKDNQAWGEFVEIYGPLIYSFCRRRRLQESDAADVTQEVLVRLSIAFRRFEYQPERGRFRDWLGTVTCNEIARFAARRTSAKVSQASPDEDSIRCVDPQGEGGSEWNDHFQWSLLHQALKRISPEFEATTWRAFEMVWLDDQPALLVSETLAIGIEKVYVAKSRVLKRLRSEIMALSDDLPFSSFAPHGVH